jgi:hypothetical protein
MIRYLFATASAAIIASILLMTTSIAIAAGDHGHGGSAEGQTGPIIDYRALTAEEATIQDVLNIYATAMEEKSVDVMEQAIIPGDFSTIESGYPNWTWEDFRDNHLLVEMDAFTDVNYEIKLISGEFQGSLGFAIYKYTASGKIQDKAVSISGLGTAILEETAEGWRIHHLHTSAPRTQLEGMGG